MVQPSPAVTTKFIVEDSEKMALGTVAGFDAWKTLS
jgi:hypothetical protein